MKFDRRDFLRYATLTPAPLVGARLLRSRRVSALSRAADTCALPAPGDSGIDHHLQFDHTSVLKLIEWRWNLPSLTARDASEDVGNIACALTFG